jgi:putative PIN family toxin of toxin-antitoxin system
MITEKQPEERLRVVLDTNVYISIFTNPKGELGAIWEHALRGTYTPLISPYIIAELAGVLREKFKWPENDIKARAKRFSRIAEIVTPKIVPHVIEDDPADDHILACAQEGQADLIVSGNKHLRRLKVYKGIPIIRPTDFLHTLAGYPMK